MGVPTSPIVAELIELFCTLHPALTGKSYCWFPAQVVTEVSVVGIVIYIELLFNILYLEKRRSIGKLDHQSLLIKLRNTSFTTLPFSVLVLLSSSSNCILHMHRHPKWLKQTVLLRSTGKFQQPSKQECYPRHTHLPPTTCRNAAEPTEERSHKLSNASIGTTNCLVSFDYKPKVIALLWGVIFVVFLYELLRMHSWCSALKKRRITGSKIC